MHREEREQESRLTKLASHSAPLSFWCRWVGTCWSLLTWVAALCGAVHVYVRGVCQDRRGSKAWEPGNAT